MINIEVKYKNDDGKVCFEYVYNVVMFESIGRTLKVNTLDESGNFVNLLPQTFKKVVSFCTITDNNKIIGVKDSQSIVTFKKES